MASVVTGRNWSRSRETWVTRAVGQIRSLIDLRFWLEAVSFIIVATPFELGIGSGYSYAIKFVALLVFTVPRLRLVTGTIRSATVCIAALVLVFLLVNMPSLSERVLMASALIMLGTVAGAMRSERWQHRLRVLIRVYLVFHLAGLTIAAAVYFATGDLVDLHGLVFPEASRVYEVGAVARISGFHNESGTYAQWMLVAVLFYSIVTGRIISMLTATVAASILLTTSLWGVIGVSLLCIAMAIEVLTRGKAARLLKFTATAALLAAAAIGLLTLLPRDVMSANFAYVLQKAALTSESALAKLEALDAYKRALPEIVVVGEPLDPGMCSHCLSPQDLGVWSNGSYYLGLIPSMLLVVFLASRLYWRFGLQYLPLLVMMLLWKAQFYDPLLWSIIGYILCGQSMRVLRRATSSGTTHDYSAPNRKA